jgi:hypothetical protein
MVLASEVNAYLSVKPGSIKDKQFLEPGLSLRRTDRFVPRASSLPQKGEEVSPARRQG